MLINVRSLSGWFSLCFLVLKKILPTCKLKVALMVLQTDTTSTFLWHNQGYGDKVEKPPSIVTQAADAIGP